MPVTKLFVEGALDVQILTPILLGKPVLQEGGPKGSLKPRARTERRENNVAAGYLRDRDFDYDPPTDLSKPTVDSTDDDVPLGWRWCRHEIENYLIDPALVSQAMAWPAPEVEQALCRAADRIRSYEAARWTVGVVRRALPPHHELRTRPEGLNEIDLPSALDSAAVNAWAYGSIAAYQVPMAAATAPVALQESLNTFTARVDEAFVADSAKVLVWFSGKDLLAGLADWLLAKGIPNPGQFRALLRDWIIANPKQTLELLPEWNGMVELVRA